MTVKFLTAYRLYRVAEDINCIKLLQVIRYLGSQMIDARPYQTIKHEKYFPPTVILRELPVGELVSGQIIYGLPAIVRWFEKETGINDLLQSALVWNRLHPDYRLSYVENLDLNQDPHPNQLSFPEL